MLAVTCWPVGSQSSLDTIRASLSFVRTCCSACFRIILYLTNMRSRSSLGASFPQNCHHGFSSACGKPVCEAPLQHHDAALLAFQLQPWQVDALAHDTGRKHDVWPALTFFQNWKAAPQTFNSAAMRGLCQLCCAWLPCRSAASWAAVVAKLSRMPCNRCSSLRLTRRPPISAPNQAVTRSHDGGLSHSGKARFRSYQCNQHAMCTDRPWMPVR